MKRSIIRWLMLVLWVGIFLWSGFYNKGTVQRVVDGDTIIVKYHLSRQTETVRLYGIDCPELAQPYGNTARRYTQFLAEDANNIVRIDPVDYDAYGRLVARVITDNSISGAHDYDPPPPEARSDDIDWSQSLATMGMAWWNDLGEYAEAQHYAQRNRLGLWQQYNPTPPWEWRRTHYYKHTTK